MLYDGLVLFHGWFLQPFIEYGFMRRALVACVAIGLACGPIGTILVLRRMSLAGDAIAHAVLPGAAVGFIFFGLSLPAMTFLFGSVLAIDGESLLLIAGASSVTLFGLAIIWRPLMVECFDPAFLRSVGGHGGLVHQFFMLMVVLTLVSAFQALGTLMAVGLLMLPATAARFWCAGVVARAILAAGLGALSGVFGLLLSYHVNVPSGPAIVLFAGGVYVLSLCLGTRDSLRLVWFPANQHKEA